MTTILRGPADKSAFRNDPTKWTGYVDPLPADDIATPDGTEHPSVSDYKKAWPKNLTDWAAREAAKTAWKFRGALVDMDEAEAVDLIAPSSNRQRDAAAKRGHTIHDLLEHRLFHPDRTLLLEADDPAHEYLDTIADIVAELAPVVVASEVIVFGAWTDAIGTAHHWAGTFDAVWLIDGEHVLVDYKSRKLGKAATRYPEEGVQLGGYSSATYWIVEDDDGQHRMAPLEMSRGLILSIAPDAWCTYDVDLDDARRHWLSTVQFKATQKSAPKMFGRAKKRKIESGGDAVHVDPAPVTSTEGTEPAPAGEPSVDAPRHIADVVPEVIHAARVAWVMRRIDVLKAHSDDAAKMLGVNLPVDVPTPKAVREGATWTPEQVGAYDEHVARVEAHFEIPFDEIDPLRLQQLRDDQVAQQAKRDAAAQPAPELPEIDEGDDWATDAEVEGLRVVQRTMLADADKGEDYGVTISRWVKGSHRNRRPFHLGRDGERTSARRLAICWAALECLDLVTEGDDPDAVVRSAIAMVIGDDVVQPAFTTGGLLGSLTTEQAKQLLHIVNTHRADIAPDGTPQLVAAA